MGERSARWVKKKRVRGGVGEKKRREIGRVKKKKRGAAGRRKGNVTGGEKKRGGEKTTTRSMECFLPVRVRPVRDSDGRIWRSIAHLVTSLFVEDKANWFRMSSEQVVREASAILDVQRWDREYRAGLVCMAVLKSRGLRDVLRVELTRKGPLGALVVKAHIAATLLQITQHPSLQPLLLKQRRAARKMHCASSACSFASVIFAVAEVCRTCEHVRARRLALDGLMVLQDHIDTDAPIECELFRIVSTLFLRV